jgi:Zinc knuckle.
MVGGVRRNQQKYNFLEEYAHRKKKVKCFFCGRKGHYSDKCREYATAGSREEFIKGKIYAFIYRLKGVEWIRIPHAFTPFVKGLTFGSEF